MTDMPARKARVLLGQVYKNDWPDGGFSFSGNLGLGRLTIQRERNGERWFAYIEEGKPREQRSQAPEGYGQPPAPNPGYGAPNQRPVAYGTGGYARSAQTGQAPLPLENQRQAAPSRGGPMPDEGEFY